MTPNLKGGSSREKKTDTGEPKHKINRTKTEEKTKKTIRIATVNINGG